ITPKGTRTWLIIKPFGRVQVLMIVPIGSAKAETSLKPLAIVWILRSSSTKRSSNAALSSLAFAAPTSTLFAANILSAFASRAFAILQRALFFASAESFAISTEAAFAFWHISVIIFLPLSREYFYVQ